jgi:hypothetical protein
MPTQLRSTRYSTVDKGRYILQQPLAFFFRTNKAQTKFVPNTTRRYTFKAAKSVNIKDDPDISGWRGLALDPCPSGRQTDDLTVKGHVFRLDKYLPG